MPIPEPMLSTRAAAWPAHGDWMMEPKWDGFRLLAAIDKRGRMRAWSRRGASLGDRLGALLAPLAEAPRGSVFDGELVALSFRDGRVAQDFATVCRATLQGDAAAATKLHLVAFDLLELAGENLRLLPWVKRTERLRESFPTGDRLRWSRSSRQAPLLTTSSSPSGSRARFSSDLGDLTPRSPNDLAQVQGKPPRCCHAVRRPTGTRR